PRSDDCAANTRAGARNPSIAAATRAHDRETHDRVRLDTPSPATSTPSPQPSPPFGARGGKCILIGRAGLEGEGVDRALQLFGEDLIDQALALDAAQAGKAGRDDLDIEMGLALGPRTGMARMAVGIVDDRKARGRQRRGELFLDGCLDLHEGPP